MKEVYVDVKCAVCGKVSSQIEFLSNRVGGTPDLDLKPNGSMIGIGEDIQECPYCHYCNYNLSESIDPRFENNLEFWNKDEDIQETINLHENSEAKRFLIIAYLYLYVEEYEKAIDALISATWVMKTKDIKDVRALAVKEFDFDLLPGIITRLVQMGDIARQNKDFDSAKRFLNGAEALLSDEHDDCEYLSKIIKFERKLIESKNNKRHNSSEVD